jgi:Ca2+-binding RTX toxin-like protein
MTRLTASPARPARRPAAARLAVEVLEARDVPALMGPFVPIQPPISIPPLTLSTDYYITGTDGPDQIIIEQLPIGMFRLTNRNLASTASSTSQLVKLPFNTTRLVIDAKDGNDYVLNKTGIPSLIYGGGGLDVIIGGESDDVIYTGDNSQTSIPLTAPSFDPALWNLARANELAADFAYGRTGTDRLYGGNGVQMLFGDAGTDYLYGRDGRDFLHGGADVDHLYGEGGNDVLVATGDTVGDQLYGGTGADVFQIALNGNGFDLDSVNDQDNTDAVSRLP